jgi:hypothetical protein
VNALIGERMVGLGTVVVVCAKALRLALVLAGRSMLAVRTVASLSVGSACANTAWAGTTARNANSSQYIILCIVVSLFAGELNRIR